MPRMQKADVSTEACLKLTAYIVCNKRGNQPRIHYKICDICRYHKKCISFMSFKESRPDLYPLSKIKDKIAKSIGKK